MDIRILGLSDIQAGYRLSEQAGWNQTPADWERLITLWPKNCFAGVVRGQVVATGTLATHGQAMGWISMILVDEGVRRQGFGTRMFQAVLDCGRRLNIETLGLDATDYGRPLYEKLGFKVRCGISRWRREGGDRVAGQTRHEAGSHTRLLTGDDWPAVLTLDKQASSVDRSSLLRRLAGEAGASVRLHKNKDDLGGVAYYRIGRLASMIGPIVALSAESAVVLLDDLLSEHDRALPDTPVVIDVLDNSPFAAVVARRHFKRQRELFRMVQPVTGWSVLDGPALFAAAGFELG